MRGSPERQHRMSVASTRKGKSGSRGRGGVATVLGPNRGGGAGPARSRVPGRRGPPRDQRRPTAVAVAVEGDVYGGWEAKLGPPSLAL
jgi:hypothetical protein